LCLTTAPLSAPTPTLPLPAPVRISPPVSAAMFNVDGKLQATALSGVGTSNPIENFTAGNFTNDGKIQVTGASNATTLTLLNDTLDDYNGTTPGLIQVEIGRTKCGYGSTAYH